jgi:putative selenium metabolism hydrolase
MPIDTNRYQDAIIDLARQLIRIQSYSSQEGPIIRFLEQKMIELGFDRVKIDAMGNLVGTMGEGSKSILFDAHVDTVEVPDEKDWEYPPFEGIVANGRLHGRGAVDMKSSVAASLYAAVSAKHAGKLEGKKVMVSCTVNEEDCDGENLKFLFNSLGIQPDFVVICEPSGNQIALGHKGKAQVKVRTEGKSAHGSAPEKGVNAVYEMAEIIQKVESKNFALAKLEKDGFKPTLVLSRISSEAASLNAVPFSCEIYLDRRTIPGETEAMIREEMDALVAGKNASWEPGVLKRKSWTGTDIHYVPIHPAWKIAEDAYLTVKCVEAFRDTFGQNPARFEFWDFSTNAVTPVTMGIPTIGFGPGDYKMAHMRDESIEVSQIQDACAFYANLIALI